MEECSCSPLCPLSVVTAAFVDTVKAVFGRPRPKVLAHRVVNVRALVSNHAMPSGDSAQAGVWACMLCSACGSVVPVMLIPATMFARVFYGAHWFGDTVVGAGAGVTVFYLCRGLLAYACRWQWLGPAPGLAEFVCPEPTSAVEPI